MKQFKSLSSDFAPQMLKDPYDKVAPDPKLSRSKGSAPAV
jgi:hypothetical protein